MPRRMKRWFVANTDPVVYECSNKIGRPKKLKFTEIGDGGLSLKALPLEKSTCSTGATGVLVSACADSQEPGETSAHSRRKEAEEDKWAALRPLLLQTRLQTLCPVQTCSHCQETQEEIIRCLDCGPTVFLCSNCCTDIHQTALFHKPFVWKEGKMYWPLTFVPHLRQLPLHQCSAVSAIDMVIFDSHGVSQDVKIDTCCHEPTAVTILRHGFWPATPGNPRIAFSLQLLELAVSLQLHGCLSLQAFVSSIKEIDDLMGLRTAAESAPDLYRNLLGPVNEYRYHRNQMAREGKLAAVDIHSCGVCHMDPSRSVLSLDGNFGLVHKHRTGGLEKPRHDAFFIKDEEVQDFVQEWSQERPRRQVVNDCSEFQAGDAIRSKNKTRKLDVTGVFGCVCQHEFPGFMLNMKQGESMAYPALLLKKLGEQTIGKRLIMYDVGCMLHRHLQHRMSDLLEHFRFAVPAFHRFAHNMSCQLTFGQRCTEGAGLHDGEGMERIWSYLRKFAPSTKQMALANRQDLLTDALMAYSHRSFKNLGKKMVKQIETAKRLKEESKSEFERVEQEMSTRRSIDVNSQDWLAAWQMEIGAQGRKKDAVKLTWNEEYAYAVVQMAEKVLEFNTSTDLSSKEKLVGEIRRLEIQSDKLQKRLRLEAPLNAAHASTKNEAVAAKIKLTHLNLATALGLAKERQFLTHLLSKYADGQSVAARIGKQVKANSQAMAKVTEELKNVGVDVSAQQLWDVDDPLYFSIEDSGLIAAQKKAALARAEYERAKEGEVAAKEDMHLLLKFLVEKKAVLDDLIKHDPLNGGEVGERHLLCSRRNLLAQLHKTCASDFAKYIIVDTSLQYRPSHLVVAGDAQPTFDVIDIQIEEVDVLSDDDIEELLEDAI